MQGSTFGNSTNNNLKVKGQTRNFTLNQTHMKKIIFPAAILLLFSFSSIKPANKLEIATVNQVQGCFIFVDAKPLNPYKYLGTIELTKKETRKQIDSGQYEDVRNALLTKLRAVYPQANGAIFHFHDGDSDQVDAIILQ